MTVQKPDKNQKRLVEFLKDELGDALLGVLIIDPDNPSEFTVHTNETKGTYTKEDFRRLGQRLIMKSEESKYYEDSYRIGKLDSEIEQFGDTTLVYLMPEKDTRVLISIDPGHDIATPSFPKDCLEILRE